MTASAATDRDPVPQLTALNGIRFFAVFHIFLYHLWSTRYETEVTKNERFSGMYGGLDALPQWLDNFLAHGYLSTSFFFVLSGFILAFLYWGADGELSTSRQRFWWMRFSRLYPVHLIVLGLTLLLTLPRFFFDPEAPSIPTAVASAVATATLTHAWFAPLVPIWSWPTWALSAIVFMYLIMPWLMHQLARLSHRQQVALLAALPLISLIPTLIFLQFFPDGAADHLNWQIFIGSTPLFWVPHFAAGMLLSRICGITRFDKSWQSESRSWFAFGDIALVALVVLCIMDPQDRAWRHILRHGLLMPLYLIVIRDLALGRGIAARLFSLPGMNFLGQLSFSIFIWQNLLMIVSFMVAFAAPAAIGYALWIAIIGLLVMSAVSAHLIEKPLAAKLRRRRESPAIANAAVLITPAAKPTRSG